MELAGQPSVSAGRERKRLHLPPGCSRHQKRRGGSPLGGRVDERRSGFGVPVPPAICVDEVSGADHELCPERGPTGAVAGRARLQVLADLDLGRSRVGVDEHDGRRPPGGRPIRGSRGRSRGRGRGPGGRSGEAGSAGGPCLPRRPGGEGPPGPRKRERLGTGPPRPATPSGWSRWGHLVGAEDQGSQVVRRPGRWVASLGCS